METTEPAGSPVPPPADPPTQNETETERQSESKADEVVDIHPEATFGDVENCTSLPIVTEVTSLATAEEETNGVDQVDEPGTEEEEEIEDMLVPHEYPEEHDDQNTEVIPPNQEYFPEENIGNIGSKNEEGPMDSCEFCHILIPIRMMEDHLRIHKQLDEPLACPKAKCTNEFLTAFDLKNHLLSIHPGTKELIPVVYNCNNCGKEMSMLSAFQIHAKHKHPNRVVKCTKEPVLTRTRNGEFVCPVCVKTFPSRKIIVKHFNDVHQLPVKLQSTIVVGQEHANNRDDEDDMDTEMPEGLHHSPRHSARISARASLQPSPPSMLRGALEGASLAALAALPGPSHGQGLPADLGEAETIVCPSCNEVYYDMAAFKRHYYRHTVRYTCRVCNKKIMGMAEYREHCGKHIHRPRAPGEVKRTCPYCGKSFIDMKIHLRKHESSCEICGLQFVHLNNMNRHYLDVHGIDLSQFAKMPDGPGGRKMNTSLDVKLDGYHKTLASIEQFEAEIASPVSIKTEKLDITCEYCALTYSSQELYNRHVITHNQRCKLCQVIIDHEQNIRPHLKNAHGINDVDNTGSLFEATIFAEITEAAPLEHLTPPPPPQPLPQIQRSNKRDSYEESGDFSGKGQKRDMMGRAECKICYRKVIDMNSHMMTHNVKCSLCDYISIHRFNLRPHMRQAHGLNDDEIDALIEDIVANPVQIWDIPPENRIHNRPAAPVTSQGRPVQTPESSVSPADSSPIHTPPLDQIKGQCRFCAKQFPPDTLKRHMKSAHNVKCGRCGKFFVHQASIYAHMKSAHGVTDFDLIKRETISAAVSDDDEEGSVSDASPIPEEEPPRKMMKPEKPKPKPPAPRPVIKSPSPSPSPAARPTSSGSKGKKCKVCKQVFEDIVGHMNTHYKPCPLCTAQFHPQGFRLHLKQKHGITDPEAVKSLEEDSSDEDDDEGKEEPEERDETPEPENLPSPVPQQSITVQKIQTPQPPGLPGLGPGSGKCLICNKNVRDFHDHMGTRHNLKCRICKTVIKHFCNVKSHMTSIHGIPEPDVRELTVSTYKPNPDQDPHGPLEVSNSVLDLSNELKEPEEDRIQCEFCDTTLKNRKYYAQHCRNIHKIKLPDMRPKQRPSDDESGKNDFLPQISGLTEFTKRQHLVPSKGATESGSKVYSSQPSKTSTPSRPIAGSHLPSRTMDVYSPLETDSCDDGSMGEDTPGEGLKIKPYKCDKCPSRFLRRRYLWRHCKIYHNEPKAYLRYKELGLIKDANDVQHSFDEGKPAISENQIMPNSNDEESEAAMEDIPEEVEEMPPDDTILDKINIDNEEIFRVGVEQEFLKGATTQSEITRRRRMLAKHKTSLRVQGGLGFGSYKCKHCHRRFTTSSALVRHLRQDSCPMVVLKRQRKEKLFKKSRHGGVSKTSGGGMIKPIGGGLSKTISGGITKLSSGSITKPTNGGATNPTTSSDVKKITRSPTTMSAIRCEVCKIYLSSQISLQRHLLTHTNEKPIKCCKCLKGFNQNVHLRVHLYRYHGIPMESSRNIGIENRSIQIQLLEKFNPEALLTLPPAEQVEVTCLVCQISFMDRRKLREHMSTHGSTLPFPCTMCPRGYEVESQLKTHLMRVHSVNPFTPAYKAQNEAQRHREEPQEEKDSGPESDMDDDLPLMKPNLSCFRCHMKLPTIDDNVAHKKVHKTASTKNYCFVCWSPFSHMRSLVRHFLTIHSDTEGSDDIGHHCRVCSITVMNLPKHIRQCHPDINIDQRACRCHYCGNPFMSIIQRKVHLLVKHEEEEKRRLKMKRTGTLLQSLGAKASYSSLGIKKKPTVLHQGDTTQRSYESSVPSVSKRKPEDSDFSDGDVVRSKSWCNECNLTYVNIRMHRVCHSGIPTYDCSKCGRIYASNGTRNRHMTICRELRRSPSLASSSSTSVHDSDTTANYKPPSSRYVPGPTSASGGYCRYCRCNIPRRLLNHLNTVHRGDRSTRFKCEHCGRMFTQSMHRRRHIRREHPEVMTDNQNDAYSELGEDGEGDDEVEAEERSESRCSNESSEYHLRNLRVMLERVDGIKAEPEDWTLKPEAKNALESEDQQNGNAEGTLKPDAAATVNSEPDARSTSTASRPSSRDGRPSIFEVMKNSDENEEEDKTAPPTIDQEAAKPAPPEKSPELGEVRYVPCSQCPTYLPTRKTEQQLAQFKLMCNACLKVDASKLSPPAAKPVLGPPKLLESTTAKKSTSPQRHLVALVHSVSGEGTPIVPPKPRSKPRPRVLGGSPFLPKPRRKKNQSAQCPKCTMKFQNKSALSSHDRLMHAGPYRLKDGVELTGAPKCEFCGFMCIPHKKTGHLRKCHPELFMNGLFAKNSEKELRLARILGRADTETLAVSPRSPGSSQAPVVDVIDDEEDPVSVDVSVDDSLSTCELEEPEELSEEMAAEFEAQSEEPPDLEYQGGPPEESETSPPNGAPHIGSPEAPELMDTSLTS